MIGGISISCVENGFCGNFFGENPNSRVSVDAFEDF
jgi:hypothetical protein